MDVLEGYLKAALLLNSDWPTRTVDALFFHALSRDATGDGQGEESDLFHFVAWLLANGRARTVVLNGSHGERFGRNIPRENWDGGDLWQARLEALGVPAEKIILSAAGMNTREENEYFLAVARINRWKTAGVVTVNYHFPRAFMGYVKAMEKSQHLMKLYAYALRRVNWFAPMTGSQGLQTMTPIGLIDAELDERRLPAYVAKGDLCTFQELFDYLQRRE